MPRIRSIKPDLWQNERVGELTLGARLLFIGMITQADDEGRLVVTPARLRAQVFPHDSQATPTRIEGWLDEIIGVGLLITYNCERNTYGVLVGWSEHQKVQHPTASRYPAPPVSAQPSPPRLSSGGLMRPHEDSGGLMLKGREGKGEEDIREAPPSGGAVSVSAWDQIWGAYLEHHDRARPTAKRRRLVDRRLKDGHPVDQLIAAIHGNHADPWCNGENQTGKTYHDFDLILRDADHVERYAALAATNGHAEEWTAERYAAVEREREEATW